MIFIASLFICSFSYSALVHATSSTKQKAWLMIALDKEELNAGRSAWSRGRRWLAETRFDELVRIFNETLKPADLGLEAQVVTEATAADLKMALRDPQTTALFWVSHASPTDSVGGLSMQGVIPDHEGANVSSLFKKIHPNVKWVGLIGCYTNTIINEYKEDGLYQANPISSNRWL